MILRPALLALTLSLASPARAQEGPNLVPSAPAPLGAVGATALAWQLYATGLGREDPVMMLTAIRLAHGSEMRAATGWVVTSPVSGPDSGSDTVAEVPTAPTGLPRDPASDAALSLALLMAEGDPALADLAADVEAGLTLRQPTSRISMAASALAAGASESWRIPFPGQSRAEVALLAEGPAGFTLQITDETGAVICRQPKPDDLAFCAFTPGWNGYFAITITNHGPTAQSYKLLSN